MKWPPIGQILTSGMPGMAHMAGNEPNFDISSKKYDVQKTVPQKYKTAWALGLKHFFLAIFTTFIRPYVFENLFELKLVP